MIFRVGKDDVTPAEFRRRFCEKPLPRLIEHEAEFLKLSPLEQEKLLLVLARTYQKGGKGDARKE